MIAPGKLPSPPRIAAAKPFRPSMTPTSYDVKAAVRSRTARPRSSPAVSSGSVRGATAIGVGVPLLVAGVGAAWLLRWVDRRVQVG